MKPRVFLSHSKDDRDFIVQLASDLRCAQVDVWFDEWEIGPGDSLRQKVYDEGISECDLFFIYLTPNSVDSHWCREELDAAFVLEVEQRGGFLALFVDSDGTRDKLSVDLRSKNIPVLSSDEYNIPLLRLAARAWQARSKKRVEEVKRDLKLVQVGLEKQLAEQQLQIERLTASGATDTDTIIESLRDSDWQLDDSVVDLAQAFHWLSNTFAMGATTGHLKRVLERKVDKKEEDSVFEHFYLWIPDIAGPFVTKGLVEVRPPSEGWDELMYLTDLGKRVAEALANEFASSAV